MRGSDRGGAERTAAGGPPWARGAEAWLRPSAFQVYCPPLSPSARRTRTRDSGATIAKNCAL